MEAVNLSNREGCPTIFSVQMEVPEKVAQVPRAKRAFHDAASASFFSF
jgi:hypothetical protein